MDDVQAEFPKEDDLTTLLDRNNIKNALVMMGGNEKNVIFNLVPENSLIGRLNFGINFNGLLNYLPRPYRCYLHLGKKCRESCLESLA